MNVGVYFKPQFAVNFNFQILILAKEESSNWNKVHLLRDVINLPHDLIHHLRVLVGYEDK